MNEFKFACPVCGQHITADSRTSGRQIECPTCFQKIIVPQAPANPDTKLILSATQVGRPRPVSEETKPVSRQRPRSTLESVMAMTGLLVVLVFAGGTAFHYRQEIVQSIRELTHTPRPKETLAEQRTYPVPTNISWSLNLANTAFPDTPAAGRINGSGFFCEKATLRGGTLTLRQGRTWPPDLGVTVLLVAHEAQDLSGKFIAIPPERPPPLPGVLLRWKDEQHEPVTQNVTAGYALKLSFGQAANGRMPGKIYLCLPDDPRSFVAGVFDAQIRTAHPPKGTANSVGTKH